MATESDLKSLLQHTVEALGYELLGIEYQPRQKNSLLRLYIDSTTGINLSDCEAVSRQVSAVLDVEDPIAGRFTLEVSSPGLDRPLFEKAHYQRFQGNTIRVRTLHPVEGRRNFKGPLLAVNEESIRIQVDAQVIDLFFRDIEQARLVP